MSAELPTEEDVLAELLLLWLEEQGLTHDVPSEQRWTPMAVGWAAWGRIQPNPSVPTIEAAIADSERRLEVERARDAIVRAVELGISKMPPAVERARTRYMLALTAALEDK